MSENEVTRERLEETKGELDAIRDTVIKVILSLQGNILDKLTHHQKDTESLLENMNKQQATILEESQTRLKQIWGELEAKQSEYEEKVRQIGRYETILADETGLVTLYHSPKSVDNVSTQEVRKLVYILDTWTQHHMKGQKASPKPEICRVMELNQSFSYYIPSLSSFLFQILDEGSRR